MKISHLILALLSLWSLRCIGQVGVFPPTASSGTPGPTGPTGPTGATGPAGAAGVAGAAGADGVAGATGASGAFISFTTGSLAPIFTAELGANPTTAPVLAFTLTPTTQNFVLSGPTSGTGVPSYRLLVPADIPALPYASPTSVVAAQAAAQVFSSNASNLTSGRIGSPVTSYLTPYLSYVAYGDSITFSSHAISQWAGYAENIGRSIGIVPTNSGASGATTNSSAQVILNAAVPNASTALESIMFGTNDVTQGGNSADQAANFGSGYLAEVAYLAIPANQKTLASAFTLSGTWTTGNYTQSRKSSTNGNTATFTVTGTEIVLATVMQSTAANGGTASLTCDGTPTGATLSFVGSSGANITAGLQPAIATVIGLTNTAHTCVVAVTSTTGKIVDLVWAAGLSGASQTTWPTLLVGNIISRNPASNAPYDTLYRPYTSAAVTAVNALGLTNVLFVDTSTTLTIPLSFDDVLHPNDGGYYLLAQAFLGVLYTQLGYTLPTQQYRGGLAINMAPGGPGNIVVAIGSTTHSLPAYVSAISLTAFGSGLIANSITTANNVSLFGASAGAQLTSGSGTTAFGANALGTITTGVGNTAMGDRAMSGSPANTITNSGFGQFACQLSSGTSNSCFGFNSGITATSANTTAASNQMTHVGANSGQSVPSATVLTNSTSIGYGAVVGASNMVQLGNTNTTLVNTSGRYVAPAFGTATICTSVASPAVCGSAAAGIVQVAAAATTLTINSSAITANTGCWFTYNVEGITAPANLASLVSPQVTGRTAGTSITISIPVAPLTNPVNVQYGCVN